MMSFCSDSGWTEIANEIILDETSSLDNNLNKKDSINRYTTSMCLTLMVYYCIMQTSLN